MLSSVNVGTCLNKPTIHQLVEVLANVVPIDRTSINAREDVDFVAAIKATGRQKLIIVALWTEVCLVFPALDALREGYGGLPSGRRRRGGTSVQAHRAELQRIVQAGAQPVGWIQLACELQRDWNRKSTARALRRSCLPGSIFKSRAQTSLTNPS